MKPNQPSHLPKYAKTADAFLYANLLLSSVSYGGNPELIKVDAVGM
ncbi:MAG: hypothetical protein GX799_02730 [Crenarchaeota archaeon]|jgi:hypothetical protein|nr:hypothetical protein [Thermoproteota archaeon]